MSVMASGVIVLLSPTQVFKFLLFIGNFVISSEIVIGNNKEAINGGSPWVANLPFKSIAFCVKITSFADAVGFSMTSRKGANPLL